MTNEKINPALGCFVDTGVTFIQFLWAECKPELEQMDQQQINGIWAEVVKNSPRPHLWEKIKKQHKGQDKKEQDSIEKMKERHIEKENKE